MTNSILILFAIVLLLLRIKPVKGIQTITMNQLKLQLDEPNKVFIDVRTEAEYRAKHIPQFQNIPLGSDLSVLPKDQEIVVLCQSGMRSKRACKQLKKLGYQQVTNVRGGMNTF